VGKGLLRGLGLANVDAAFSKMVPAGELVQIYLRA
jgi:hypothetical protein